MRPLDPQYVSRMLASCSSGDLTVPSMEPQSGGRVPLLQHKGEVAAPCTLGCPKVLVRLGWQGAINKTREKAFQRSNNAGPLSLASQVSL